jgi:hypothetical protein
MDMKMPLITIICLMHIVEATASRESLMTDDSRCENTLAGRKRRRAEFYLVFMMDRFQCRRPWTLREAHSEQ